MTVSHAHPATGPRERVALVGLGPDSLDLIHLVRERGGEVCLVADPDPGSRTHALAAVFRVPSTQELERVEESGCDLLVLPDEAFAADTWQARWNAAGLRCLTVEQAWRHFSEPEIHAPAGADYEEPGDEDEIESLTQPMLIEEPPLTEAPPMTHTTLEHEVPPAPAAVSFYPASMRATATHLAAFLDEQRSATDAAHGHAWLWDEVLGDLVALREVTSGVTPVDGPGDWAQRWIRRAWSERRALVFQESPLVPEGGVPQRSRAMLALPVGDEGILYLEDAWLPADVRAPGREGLARVARQWADSVAASRAELARVLRQRIQDHVGPAVFDILPEDGACDPWPSTAARLAELLEADAVVFHFPDGGAVAAAPSLPDARLEPLVEMLAGMPADALRALPRLAARARTPEGHALREMGLTSLLGWARGDGLERVAVGAVRAVESGRDEFHPEHLVALKKLLALASALSRPA